MRGKREGKRLSVAEGRYDGYRMYLRNQRIRCGFTQELLAKKLKLSRVALTQYERGAREPDFETCLAIKRILDAESVEKILERYHYADGIFVGDLGSKELGIQ